MHGKRTKSEILWRTKVRIMYCPSAKRSGSFHCTRMFSVSSGISNKEKEAHTCASFSLSCARCLLAQGTALVFTRLLRGPELHGHLQVMSLTNYCYSTPR